MPVERVPTFDIIEMVTYGKQKGAKLLGPGSIGVNAPGVGVLGWLGGSVEFSTKHFVPGHVGVISRSGGQSGTLPYVIAQAGFGVKELGALPAPAPRPCGPRSRGNRRGTPAGARQPGCNQRSHCGAAGDGLTPRPPASCPGPPGKGDRSCIPYNRPTLSQHALGR